MIVSTPLFVYLVLPFFELACLPYWVPASWLCDTLFLFGSKCFCCSVSWNFVCDVCVCCNLFKNFDHRGPREMFWLTKETQLRCCRFPKLDVAPQSAENHGKCKPKQNELFAFLCFFVLASSSEVVGANVVVSFVSTSATLVRQCHDQHHYHYHHLHYLFRGTANGATTTQLSSLSFVQTVHLKAAGSVYRDAAQPVLGR